MRLPNWFARLLRGESARAVLARGALAVFTLRVFGVGLAFAAQVFIARTLGKDAFGQYVYVLSWVSLLVIFSKTGLDTATIRFLPEYNGKGEWGLMRGFLNRSRQTVLAASLLTAIALGLAVRLIGPRMSETLSGTFYLGCLLLPVLVLLQIHSAGLRALKRVVLAEAPQAVLRPFLLAGGVLLVLLVAGYKPGALEAMGVNLAATLALLLLAGLLFLHATPPEARDAPPQYDTRRWLRTASSMLLIAGFSIVLNQTSVIMVGAVLGTSEAGFYSAASRVALLVTFALSAVNYVFAPMISELHAQGKREELQRMVTLAARGIFAASLPACVALFALGRWVLGWFGPDFTQAYPALAFLLAGQLVHALAGSVGIMMIMTGHHRQATWIVGGCALLNVVLNAALIPTLGIAGAGLASALTMVLWNVIMIVYVVKRIGINPTVLALRR